MVAAYPSRRVATRRPQMRRFSHCVGVRSRGARSEPLAVVSSHDVKQPRKLSRLMVRSAARRVSNHEGTQVDPGPPILRDGPSGLLRMRRCWQSRDATQRSLLHSRAAFVRRGSSFLFASIPETRGWRSADRRTLLCYVARARRDDRVSETRAVPLQPGRPLGAPSWRFSAGDPCCRLRQWHRSRPATCPRHRPYGLMGEVPDLPRCGSRRNRGTPLPAPSSGSSPETPPLSEDDKSYTTASRRSQELSSLCSRKLCVLERTVARAGGADAGTD